MESETVIAEEGEKTVGPVTAAVQSASAKNGLALSMRAPASISLKAEVASEAVYTFPCTMSYIPALPSFTIGTRSNSTSPPLE